MGYYKYTYDCYNLRRTHTGRFQEVDYVDNISIIVCALNETDATNKLKKINNRTDYRLISIEEFVR